MRFVVLHHTGIDDPHFDFMFETSDTSQLVTFRLQQWPLHQSQAAIKLRDHRRAYLDFQGDISMGRGHVERVDEGNLDVAVHSHGWSLEIPDRLKMQFEPDDSGGKEAWWVTIQPR